MQDEGGVGVGSALNKPLKDVVAYEVIFEDFLSVLLATTDLQEFKLEESHYE